MKSGRIYVRYDSIFSEIPVQGYERNYNVILLLYVKITDRHKLGICGSLCGL